MESDSLPGGRQMNSQTLDEAIESKYFEYLEMGYPREIALIFAKEAFGVRT